MKLYAPSSFTLVVANAVSPPSLYNSIVTSGNSVPSGATHVFVPLTLTLSCSIVFVKFVPSFTDVVYPVTASSVTVYTITSLFSLYFGKWVNIYIQLPSSFGVTVFWATSTPSANKLIIMLSGLVW